MLTEKQITNLRKTVRQKWVPWLFLFVTLFHLFLVGGEIFRAHRLCSLSGLPWKQALSFAFSHPRLSAMYSGIEVASGNHIKDAMFYSFGAIWFFGIFLIMRITLQRQAVLLEYIDKLKDAQSAPQPPPQ